MFKEEEKLQNCELLKSQADIDHQKLVDRHTWYLGETRDGKKDNPWYARSGLKVSSVPDTISEKLETHLQRRKERKKRADEVQKVKEDPFTFINNATSKVSKSIPSSSSSASKPKGPKTIEELRKERLERELRERERMNINPTAERHVEDKRYYHSQFHPDIKPTKKWYQ